MKKIYYLLFIMCFGFVACDDDEDFDKGLLGEWEQTYPGLSADPVERTVLIINGEHSGRFIQERITNDPKDVEVISDREIKEVMFYKVNDIRYIRLFFKDEKDKDDNITYTVHEIRPEYLYLIRGDKLFTFIRKYK